MQEKINVFIIGAQKAGTTSLYDWIGQHPEVEAPEEIKDYHYFTNEEIFKKGAGHVESFYTDSSLIKVHAAVNYMYFADLASSRLNDYNSDAKIVICLRNPVERAVSAYRYFFRTLREKHTFSKALCREDNEDLRSFSELSNNTYKAHGDYASQIEYFLKFYPVDRVHFIYFENLVDEELRDLEMFNLFNFFGAVDSKFKVEYSHLNNSGGVRSGILNYLISGSPVSRFLSRLLPFGARKRIRNVIAEKNVRAEKIKVEISPVSKDLLSEYYRAGVRELSLVVGKDLVRFWRM